MLGPEEIAKRFGTTATEPEGTVDEHRELRGQFIRVAQYLDVVMPDSREKSLAMTQLEDAAMWANKALAQWLPLKNAQLGK